MKVEQTVQRVSKGPGGHYVVGMTRSASALAEFELLYHEIGSITNVLNYLTTNHPLHHTECHLQHALNTTRRLTLNRNVTKLLDFVLGHQNPYSVLVNVRVPLHNLLTKQAVHREVYVRLLNCVKNGKHVYQSFRQERLLEKSKKMSETISKRKLPHFTDQLHKMKATILKEKNISSKEVAEAQRT